MPTVPQMSEIARITVQISIFTVRIATLAVCHTFSFTKKLSRCGQRLARFFFLRLGNEYQILLSEDIFHAIFRKKICTLSRKVYFLRNLSLFENFLFLLNMYTHYSIQLHIILHAFVAIQNIADATLHFEDSF